MIRPRRVRIEHDGVEVKSVGIGEEVAGYPRFHVLLKVMDATVDAEVGLNTISIGWR
jgi:hypothetical protein